MTDAAKSPDPRLLAFERLLAVVDRLRDPDGCPWDRKQTLGSMAPHLLEEAYEVVDALVRDRTRGVKEELGDLLMNILLASRIAQDSGAFSLEQVSDHITDKLIRRHPHVFGETKIEGEDQVAGVLKNWEAIKRKEREGERATPADVSALDGVPAALPAMARAHRLVDKAATVGFVWPDARTAANKLDEEIAELEAVLELGADPSAHAAQEEEIGDVLFCVAALAHRLEVDPELAVRKAAQRFEDRFRRLERDLGKSVKDAGLDELLLAWQRAKAALRSEEAGPLAGAPAEWIAAGRKMARVRASLEKRVRDLPPDLLAKKPAPEVATWSVRDVIEHLIDVEEHVAKLFRALDLQARRDGVAPYPSTGLVEPPAAPIAPRPGRVEGPPPKPRPDLATTTQLLEELSAARARTLEAIARITACDPRRLLAPHPVFGPIDALQWGDFLAFHEARHGDQVDRILKNLTS